ILGRAPAVDGSKAFLKQLVETRLGHAAHRRVNQTGPDLVYGDTVGREANGKQLRHHGDRRFRHRILPALRGCDDGIRGGYEYDRSRAVRKVAVGREHPPADGLGEEEGPARIHGEIGAMFPSPISLVISSLVIIRTGTIWLGN